MDSDEVIVSPGTYPLTDALIVDNAIVVRGPAGQPRPLIDSTAGLAVQVNSVAATLQRLAIEQDGINGGLQFLNPGASGAVGEDLFVYSVSNQASACQFNQGAGATLRNSICWATSNGSAVSATDFTSSTYTASLRNVTAASTGTLSFNRGITVSSGSAANVTIQARNVIALGGGPSDVAAFEDVGGEASIELANSNYDAVESTSTGTITPAGSGTNQAQVPVLADPAAGDFHQLAGSPTIDAGDSAFASGFDIDGDPRSIDGDCGGVAEPDIGADEFVVTCPSPAPQPGDTTPPETTITKQPKDKTKKKQATFEFSSSEPGSTFECKRDGGAFAPCASGQTFKVKKGKHSFEVRAKDAAGNVDATPATDAWKVKKKKKKK